MALNAIAPLLIGGGLGTLARRGILDYFENRDRSLLSEGIEQALGRAPGIFDPSSADPEMMAGQVDPGAGLLADPRNLANQLQFASDIVGLPGGGTEIGASLISQFLGFDQQRQTQALGFDQQDKQQANQFEFTAEQNQLSRDDANERARLDREQRLAIANANRAAQHGGGLPGMPGVDMGSVPSGAYQVMTPQGPVTVYTPGTKQYQDAQAEIGTYEQAVTNLDDMIGLLEDVGDEQIGPKSGQMGILYGDVVAGIAKLRDLGVLQEGEAERLEEQLADPTSWTSTLRNEDTMIAQYRQVLKQMQAKLRLANQKYSLWGLGSELETATPTQIQELQAEQAAREAAEAQGLTVITGTPPPVAPLPLPRPPAPRESEDFPSGQAFTLDQLLRLFTGGQ